MHRIVTTLLVCTALAGTACSNSGCGSGAQESKAGAVGQAELGCLAQATAYVAEQEQLNPSMSTSQKHMLELGAIIRALPCIANGFHAKPAPAPSSGSGSAAVDVKP